MYESPEFGRERASELEFFKWFYMYADFGPAHSDVLDYMQQMFMESTGKNIPLGYNYASDGETIIDRE